MIPNDNYDTTAPSTTYQFDLDGRTVDLEIRLPGFLEETFLSLRLFAVLPADTETATLEEEMEAAEIIAEHTTELPRDLIEQLPSNTLAGIMDAVGELIEERQLEQGSTAEVLRFDAGTVTGDADVQWEKDGDYSESLWTPWRNLLEVAGIGETKAEALYENGYETVSDLIDADQSELSEVDGIGNALAARIKADVGGTNWDVSAE